jgi:hypothetical protein
MLESILSGMVSVVTEYNIFPGSGYPLIAPITLKSLTTETHTPALAGGTRGDTEKEKSGSTVFGGKTLGK